MTKCILYVMEVSPYQPNIFLLSTTINLSSFLGLSCNCPVGLALAEAHRIYPNRPFGCIVSIGLDPN